MKKYQLLVMAASAAFCVSAFATNHATNNVYAVGAKQLLIADDQSNTQSTTDQSAGQSSDQTDSQSGSDDSSNDQNNDDTDND